MKPKAKSSLRRRTLALLGAVALTSMLMAPSALAASRPHAITTITWLMRVETRENPWERAEIKGFEAANPDIKITLITAPNPNNGFDIKFNTLLQSGTPADIWSHLGQSGFADYYHRGLLLNLSPLIKSMNYNFGSTPKNLVNTYNIGGSIYGIPSITLGSYLFYNKDIFDAYNKAHPTAKIPYPTYNWDDRSWTWSKMVAEGKLLTNSSNHTYGLVDSLWPPMHYAWLASTDVWPKASYQTGLPKAVNMTQPGIEKYIGQIADWDNSSKLGLSPSESEQIAIGNTGVEPFVVGNVAMGMTGGWGFRNYLTARFHWAAAAIPWTSEQLAKGGPRDTLFTDPYMIYKKTKNPEAVFKFIQYLTNHDSMVNYIKSVGFTPSNPDYLGLWYQQFSQVTGMPVENLKTLVAGARKYGFESPNHLIVNFATIEHTMTQGIQGILLGNKPVHAGLLQVQSDVDKILANTK
jgi:multiple sugar transport system substrate-binding protein